MIKVVSKRINASEILEGFSSEKVKIEESILSFLKSYTVS